MLRRHLRARTRALKSSSAALLLIALAGLADPALAQLPTTCPNFSSNASGTTTRLRLNHVIAQPGGCQEDPNPPTVLVPGMAINGCYDGDEFDPMGNRLGWGTTCTVCQPGQPGCTIYSPPLPLPMPIYIPPDLLPDPFNPFPPDPEGWPPPNPWDGLPDDEPPYMPPFKPPSCLGFWYWPG